MSPQIETPVKGFTGTVVGVDFKDGVGETENPAAIAYFARQGYKILADEKEHELTPKQKLQAEAEALGLHTKGTVDELKARISEHQKAAETTSAGADEKASEGGDTK